MMKISKEENQRSPDKHEPTPLSSGYYLRASTRTLLLQRASSGHEFGFTLRNFVVYPPDTLRALKLDSDKDSFNSEESWAEEEEEEAMETMFVREVRDGSAAQQAGLGTGDRIISINGQPLAGKSYPQVTDLIDNSGETLQLLVVPKEEDILQLCFSSSAAYQPVDRQPVVRSALHNTLSRLLYDMWYSSQRGAAAADSSQDAKSSKSSSLASFITRTMKAFIAHPPDFKMLSNPMEKSRPSLPSSSQAGTSSGLDSRKGSTDLRAALSHQRREFFCGTSRPDPREEEEEDDQVHNSLRLVAQRLRQFESGTMQAKSMERTKFYRSEISNLAGQSPTRIVSKRAAHFESLSPPPGPSGPQRSAPYCHSISPPGSAHHFKPISPPPIAPPRPFSFQSISPPSFQATLSPPSLVFHSSPPTTLLEESSSPTNHQPPFSSTSVVDSNGIHPQASDTPVSVNGVVLRRKPGSPDLQASDLFGLPATWDRGGMVAEESGAVRRISYLKATERIDSDISEDEEVATPTGPAHFDSLPTSTPSTDHKLQKLKSFFGEKTPRIKHAIQPTGTIEVGDTSAKQGLLVCKLVTVDGKRASDRSWRPVWALLLPDTLYLLKERKEPLPNQVECGEEDHAVPLAQITVSVAQDYTKRKHVLRVRLLNSGTELLLQADSRAAMMDWLASLQGSLSQGWPPISNSVLERAAAYEQQIHHKKLPFRSQYRSPATSHHHSPSAHLKSRRASHGDELALPNKLSHMWRRGKGGPRGVGGSMGVRLEDCPASDTGVPQLVALCAGAVEANGGLETVGIYRVPGNSAAVAQLSDMAASSPDLATVLRRDPRWADVHVVSSLLKAFFRKLPDPLISAHLYPRFIAAAKMADPVDRLTTLRKLILQLPPAHLQTLRFLIQHLRCIADQSHINKMEPRNLAIVFGPTLVRSGDGNMVTMVTDMSHQCYLIETMILYADWLFGDVRNVGEPFITSSTSSCTVKNGGTAPVPDSPAESSTEAAVAPAGPPSQQERVRNFELETRAMLQRQRGPARPCPGWDQLQREWTQAKLKLWEDEDSTERESSPPAEEGRRRFSATWSTSQRQCVEVSATLPSPGSSRRHTIAEPLLPIDHDDIVLLDSPSDASRHTPG